MDGFGRAHPSQKFALDFDALRAFTPPNSSESFIELSTQCCAYDQGDRPTMDDALDWLNDLYVLEDLFRLSRACAWRMAAGCGASSVPSSI